MTAVNRSSQVFLTPPSTLTQSSNTNNTPIQSPLGQSDKFLTGNIIPNNYPQVSNNIPGSIFPQQQTDNNQGQIPVSNNTQSPLPSQTTTPPAAQTGLKQISMTEAQWAVKFEEKVKKGVQPTPQETAKYQDIVTRFKANPKVDSSILEILSAQSTSLGAQVASMRYGSNVTQALRGLRPGVSSSIGSVPSAINGAEVGAVSGGVGTALRGLGTNLLKGSGLGAIVSGGFSLITNGIQVLQGKKTWSEVGGTVAADTIGGGLSGITGTLGAGVAGLLIGGATGLIPTLVIGVGAMGGAWLGDKLFRSTGMYDKVKDGVTNMITSHQAPPQTYQPQYNNTAMQR
ncbi:MAG: hypothetical protein H7263_14405 [Candidatus Sericytochromatia bacterium]|nr:hypothetical protein [Candidatus Sericytochromatia bacterium]